MKKIVTWTIAAIAALGVLATVGIVVGARTAAAPDNLGLRDGKLAPCPDSPNCVSSQSSDSQHSIAAIPYGTPSAGSTVYSTPTLAAKKRILEIVGEVPRATLIDEQANYLHILFRSPTIGFPDDTEFYFDEAAQLIQVRSAARLGRSDLDKNRERVEQIRAAFAGR